MNSDQKSDIKNVEINVYLDKLDKLNTEYGKASTMEDIIDVTNKMDDSMVKVNYLLNFFELTLENPEEINETLQVENDITNINDLQKRLDDDENNLDRYSLEKQCEEYIKLKLSLNKIKESMKGKSIVVRKIIK
jgi:hypothetical protein